ncbi:5317_t:CDS:2, partial [Entrophospora sp. SA101]
VIDFLVKFESLADFLMWYVFEIFGVIRTGSSNVVVSSGVIVGGVVGVVVALSGFLCIYSKITIVIKLGISVALNMK